jgi:hypothetical protein
MEHTPFGVVDASFIYYAKAGMQSKSATLEAGVTHWTATPYFAIFIHSSTMKARHEKSISIQGRRGA